MELRSQSFGFCVFVNIYPVYVVVITLILSAK